MSTSESATAKPTAEKTQKRRLGRGLVSLVSAPVAVQLPRELPKDTSKSLPDAEHHQSQIESHESNLKQDSPAQNKLVTLNLTDVHPNPHQPRQDFDADSLKALASSISKSGMMQPIIVRVDRKGGYQIIAGERRWRASQMLGLTQIHAIIHDVDDRLAAQFSLVENLQREDLNPIERAEAFQRLIDEFGLTHQEIADSVGLERSTITNHLRLNEHEDSIKDAVRAGRLSLGHARALLAITNLQQRRGLAARAVQQAWSVRELERRVKDAVEAHAAGIHSPSNRADSTMVGAAASGSLSVAQTHMANLEKQLSSHLGTKVRIRAGRTKGSGKLIIDFFNLDQFEGLMNRLGFEPD